MLWNKFTVYAFSFFQYEILKKTAGIKQTIIAKIYIQREGESVLVCLRLCKVCVCMCKRAKYIIACGRCPAPLPPQKPRDVTASCSDVDTHKRSF